MKTKICLKKLRGLIVTPSSFDNSQLAATFMASLMSCGYILSKPLFDAIQSLSSSDITDLHKDVMQEVKALKGADVKYQPMYPNFPQQVMDASKYELFVNAITHYWSLGTWLPTFEKLPRELAFENVKMQELRLATQQDFYQVFTRLVASNDSLSDEDKEIIEWFMANESDHITFPDNIPFKENMCVVAGMMLVTGRDITPLVKTATDVLRIVTYLNEGDVSLAANTKFKTMSRPTRRMFTKILENVINEEDIHRHRNKWVRLFHTLHVGDFSQKVYDIAKKVRNNERIVTFNSEVEAHIRDRNLPVTTALLSQRPGEFARRLDHLMRLADSKMPTAAIASKFLEIASGVPTRIAVQMLGHLRQRENPIKERVVFPKGQTQYAKIIEPLRTPLKPEISHGLQDGLVGILTARFNKLAPLGKVWIDENLRQCPIPTQQRSASRGALSVARGTRLPFGDNKDLNTLRFFIHWVGQDIDLSATLHDENFKLIENISYTNLKSHKYQACHSGDITYAPAPNGACEFIDITVDSAAKNGIRYVVMNVFVFSGPTFDKHERCYAGWMLRSHPKSNEIFDAKTVQQKIDLTSSAKNAIPVVFDVVNRQAIWCDLGTRKSARGSWGYDDDDVVRSYRGNNVQNNAASIQQTLKAIVGCKNKLSLYDLFRMHAEARGELTENREEAKTVFAMTPGEGVKATPYDINIISSEFLA